MTVFRVLLILSLLGYELDGISGKKEAELYSM